MNTGIDAVVEDLQKFLGTPIDRKEVQKHYTQAYKGFKDLGYAPKQSYVRAKYTVGNLLMRFKGHEK